MTDVSEGRWLSLRSSKSKVSVSSVLLFGVCTSGWLNGRCLQGKEVFFGGTESDENFQARGKKGGI